MLAQAINSCRFELFKEKQPYLLPPIGVNIEFNPLVGNAFDWAVQIHAGERRLSGELYSIHLIEALAIYQQLFKNPDPDICAAILMHDTQEYNPAISSSEIAKRLNTNVAFIVHTLTVRPHQDKRFNAWNLYQAALQHHAVIIAKGADAFSNMHTTEALPPLRRLACAIRVRAQYFTWLPIWKTRIPSELRIPFFDLWNQTITLAENDIDFIAENLIFNAHDQLDQALEEAEKDIRFFKEEYPQYFIN